MTTTNELYIEVFWKTSEKEAVRIRANAVFIYAKLVEGGVDVKSAKAAVEQLYSDGWDQGMQEEAFENSAEGQ